jgi:hypothetical protein
MLQPSDQVADWLQSVLKQRPVKIRAVYVEYMDAFTQNMVPLVCFNAFGFESLADGCFDASNKYHVGELGDFTWEPAEDCRFQANDYADTNWMSVLKNAAQTSEVTRLAAELGIQFVIGEHDGDVFAIR